jgi:hypothetical protein
MGPQANTELPADVVTAPGDYTKSRRMSLN